MGATKVGELKTVNAVLRRALKAGMPLKQFKKVVGALEPQLKAGMQAQLTRAKLERYYRDNKSENTQQVVDEKADHFHVRTNNSFGSFRVDVPKRVVGTDVKVIRLGVHDLLRIFRLVVPVVTLQLCPRQLGLHPRLELRLQCADHLFELRQRHPRF